MTNDPFVILGIDETATDDAIREAYIAAIRIAPPDRDPEGFRRIREAYEQLRDPERRVALRLFGPAPLSDLMALAEGFPDERHHIGPELWLNILREPRR
jgi:curved DNA-binding protein CbpA